MSLTPHIDNHFPLISPRIEFQKFASRPLPPITPRIDYHALVEGQTNRPIWNPGDDMYVPDEGNRRRNSVDDMYIPDEENLGGAESQEEPPTEPHAETEPTEDVKPSPGVPAAAKEEHLRSSALDNQAGQIREDIVWKRTLYRPHRSARQAEVHALAKTHLDTAVCYKRQADYKVARICKQMIDKHEMLKPFVQCWPSSGHAETASQDHIRGPSPTLIEDTSTFLT
ncbi:hypothetical protein EV421DRAFT_1743996 [Armillaria borealis]|uniref:Uncharacterized protein n=1 Tax=Armillaria borealis TaxID=47425 RepID=A0AA39ME85_9AGAR|nr:hypothetical protein EV421DRAFT_1743996 [Armillaria borealis]